MPAPPARLSTSSTPPTQRWRSGVAGLSVDELARPAGSSEGPFADRSLAALVLHVNREVLHHGAEIALLRDLYLREFHTG